MKGQDLLVLSAMVAHPERKWTFPELAQGLRISASESHAAVRRLADAGLVDPLDRRACSRSVEEFLLHGMRYVFPCRPGPVMQGVPTAHSAAPLAKRIRSAAEEAYVWPHPDGTVRGQTIEPVYRSAPDAALGDPDIHAVLALIDALRVGRARERAMAAQELSARIRSASPSH